MSITEGQKNKTGISEFHSKLVPQHIKVCTSNLKKKKREKSEKSN